MSGSFLFRELLAAIAIIILIVWCWKGMKGTAGSWTRWVVALVLITIIAITGPWLYKTSSERQAGVSVQNNTSAAKMQVTKQPEYEWYWKLPHGQFINGRNESARNERTAELIPRGNDEVWADLHYVEYGSPEILRIRLRKTGDKVWEGSCEQDNPRESCRLSLVESTPGTYGGQIIWKDGRIGTCYLSKK